MLKINEIFDSISGEAGHPNFPQGTFCTFIRFQECNLACKWCFGIVPGRRKPKITYSRSANKKLNEVCVGDKLMTFDKDTQEIVETEVIQTFKREVHVWLRLTIEGTQYFVTEEHPFFTNRGLIPANELKIGDEILHATYQQKMSFHKILNNPMKRPEVALKSAANTDYKKQGKAVALSIQKRKDEGTYTPTWELLTSEQKDAVRKRISIANSGENNPNWQGGKQKNYQALKSKIKNRKITKCSICKKDFSNSEFKPSNGLGLDVHHIDGNVNNDSKMNLQPICESCHYSLHQIGYNFWKFKRKDGKKLSPNNGQTVEKIKRFDRKQIAPSVRPKPLTVYNIECSPHNSYLIDNMWVHNCDTKHSRGKYGHKTMLLEENTVVQKVGATQNIVITGGEPQLQQLGLSILVRNLTHLGKKVQIETNGTFMPVNFNSSVTWVVDYKLPSSGMNNKMLSLFSFLEMLKKGQCVIKFVYDDKKDIEIMFLKIKALVSMMEIQFVSLPFAPFLLSPTENGKQFSQDVLKKVFDFCIQDYCVFSLQIHKLINLK